jgi:hypothetical protein
MADISTGYRLASLPARSGDDADPVSTAAIVEACDALAGAHVGVVEALDAAVAALPEDQLTRLSVMVRTLVAVTEAEVLRRSAPRHNGG